MASHVASGPWVGRVVSVSFVFSLFLWPFVLFSVFFVVHVGGCVVVGLLRCLLLYSFFY